MQVRHTKVWLALFVTGLFAATSPVIAHDDHDDDCRIKEITSVTPLSANTGTYTPPAVPSSQPIFLTINLKTKGKGTCRGSLAFNRPSLPATLGRVGGGGSLPYVIQTAAGGGTSLLFSGVDPQSHRLDFTVPSNAHSVTLTVYVRMQQPGLAPVAAGAYGDHPTLQVFNRQDWHRTLVGSRPFTVAGTVASVCQLPAPNVASLSFNSAISNGLPNPAVVLTAKFTNVSCTAPARIRLSGNRLEPTSPISPVANFDNFIHWQASATFGAASVLFDTRTASQASSAVQNVASGATSSVTISVNINLLQGQRVIAGTYSNILTVTIDPSL